MLDLFAVPIFFICFRETLETGVIVSVLLAFLHQTLDKDQDRHIHKKLRRQVWLGAFLGLVICLCVAAGIIGAFYGFKKDSWAAASDIWEGTFALLASIIITIMGAVLLRISKLQDKWRIKLSKALAKKDEMKDEKQRTNRFNLWCEKYAMFILPFVTVLREGLEAVAFIAGVGMSLPAQAFPLAVIVGVACGCLVSWLMYIGGSMAKIQTFLIISTCFLYLIAAGLFSKAVWLFENDKWNKVVGGDAAEVGSGAGSYDIRQSVWHVNCCNAELNGGGGWGIFNAILGWQNSATYGSVISYNVYWIVVGAWFIAMKYKEQKGHWPFLTAKRALTDPELGRSSSKEQASTEDISSTSDGDKIVLTTVRSTKS